MSNSIASLRLLAAAGGLALGCGAPEHKMPAWMQPLDPTDQAAAPAAVAGDPFPESVNVVTGTTSDYSWGHSHGWIHSPIGTVWKAMQDLDVIVDRRTVAQWSITKTNVDSTATVSFIAHNVVQNVLTVTLDTEWREGPANGDAGEPQVVAIRNDLQASSIFVSVLEDSVRLIRHDADTTEFESMRHGKTLSPTPETDIRTYENDLYNSVVARVHGQPLPTY
jgi:hypothetical protein